MILQKNELYTVDYTKKGSEHSSLRDVIPLTEVPKNIKVLDATGLNELEKQFLLKAQRDYQEYVDTYLASMFKFDVWYEHTRGEKFPERLLQIKTFTVENVKIIE